MAENWEVERQQHNSLERLERSHQNALTRQRENEVRRQTFQREAVIIEGENEEGLMNLKHDLDKENRLLDHAFNRAEDAREVERLATEITVRRRDDFIRHQWNNDSDLFALEAKVIEALAGGAIADHQSRLDHSHTMKAKTADHSNALEFATHENELDKDNFEFKERLKLKLSQEFGCDNDLTVQEVVTKLERN